MGTPSGDRIAAFMATVSVGDVLTGTVAEMTPSGALLSLDQVADEPVGFIGDGDLSWRSFRLTDLRRGDRVCAEVIAVDRDKRQIRLSRSATENPLGDLSTTPIETPDEAVRLGDQLAVTVTAIDLPQRRLSLSRCH